MKAQPLIVYLPDRRDVVVDRRWTRGNNKIGESVYTYSRFAGRENFQPGIHDELIDLGTCPGSTPECEAICYAKRIKGEVTRAYHNNSSTSEVPPIPADAKIVRAHVSGDFDTPEYILSWVKRLTERPDVTFWAYTRSWRCHSLLEFLEQLRALPNVQLFASMDASCQEMPPFGWRRAWIKRSFDSAVRTGLPMEERLHDYDEKPNNLLAETGQFELIASLPTGTVSREIMTPAYVCPEETGRKKDCVACRYCFDGRRNDVVFLEH